MTKMGRTCLGELLEEAATMGFGRKHSKFDVFQNLAKCVGMDRLGRKSIPMRSFVRIFSAF